MSFDFFSVSELDLLGSDVVVEDEDLPWLVEELEEPVPPAASGCTP